MISFQNNSLWALEVPVPSDTKRWGQGSPRALSRAAPPPPAAAAGPAGPRACRELRGGTARSNGRAEPAPGSPGAPGEGRAPPGSRSGGAVQVGRETGTGNAAGTEPLGLAGSLHCERGRERERGEGSLFCAGCRTGLLERKGEFYNARAPSSSS